MTELDKGRSYLTYSVISFLIIALYFWWVLLQNSYDDTNGLAFYILIGIPYFIYALAKAVVSGSDVWKKKLFFTIACMILWIGLACLERPLTHVGLKLRVHFDPIMSNCAKNGIYLEDHTVFAVCQFKQISTGMGNTHYGVIIYDTTNWDSDVQKKFREDVLHHYRKYDSNVVFTIAGLKRASVEKITGDYYRVVF